MFEFSEFFFGVLFIAGCTILILRVDLIKNEKSFLSTACSNGLRTL
jgi:hypothetical protein